MRTPLRRALFRTACSACCVSSLLAGVAAPAWAQVTVPTIHGVVVDSATGVGVAGAELRWRNVRAVTDAAGVFRFYGVRTAADTLHVRRLGFAARRVAIAGDAIESVQITVGALPQQLSPTVIQAVRTRYTGRLAGYYQRLEKSATGQFITRAELDKDNQGLLSHILQHAPNVQVRRGRGVPLISMRGKECRPLVWLDGAQMAAGTVDLDSFSPRSLHGVELYLGSVSTPQQFQGLGGKSECGTILLWSRGPDTDPVGDGSSSSAAELERLIASASVYTVDQVDAAAVAMPGAPPVAFPPLLRATGVTGSVIAEFVVDTNGVVDGATIGFVAASHPAFAEAVRVALSGASFSAARLNGRPVRQLVRQRFNFGT